MKGTRILFGSRFGFADPSLSDHLGIRVWDCGYGLGLRVWGLGFFVRGLGDSTRMLAHRQARLHGVGVATVV